MSESRSRTAGSRRRRRATRSCATSSTAPCTTSPTSDARSARRRSSTTTLAVAHHGAEFPFANMGVVAPAAGPTPTGPTRSRARAPRSPDAAPFVIASPFPTPDLRDRGCELVGHPPFMTRAAGAATVPEPDGLEIVPVTDAADSSRSSRRRSWTRTRPATGAPCSPHRSSTSTASRCGSPSSTATPVATALAHHGGRVNGVEMISCLPDGPRAARRRGGHLVADARPAPSARRR